MPNRFASIPASDATGISASLLATVATMYTLPKDARRLAKTVAPALPALTTDAQTAHDELVTSLGAKTGAVGQRGGGVEKAKKAEKHADLMVSALHGRLASDVQAGTEGAAELLEYLFPKGLTALTRVTGRPQRAAYDQWVATWDERLSKGSAADLDVAAAWKAVTDAITTFGDVLDGKDELSQAASGAVDAKDDVRQTWNLAMEDLVEAVGIVKATEPDRFESWLAPLLEWKRAQEARVTRRHDGEEAIEVQDGSGSDMSG